ncbi:MAG: hypothetical protein KME16_04060 [Scytolyngbya sp. HA4215-MV1]|jgi:hypothetical protein|nr:hypothetical protein [Scytolyngbya sp. HA4215-MV1]
MLSSDPVTSTPVQIIFHYINGHSEGFIINEPTEEPLTRQEIRQEMRRFLNDSWWIIKLPEETVFINASNVLKIEMKPPLESLQGEGVLSNAERITALNRVR